MADDAKGVCTFAEAMRSWAEVEVRKAVDDRQFGELARAELARRARPCTCCLGQLPRRDCPRHEGRLP